MEEIIAWWGSRLGRSGDPWRAWWSCVGSETSVDAIACILA